MPTTHSSDSDSSNDQQQELVVDYGPPWDTLAIIDGYLPGEKGNLLALDRTRAKAYGLSLQDYQRKAVREIEINKAQKTIQFLTNILTFEGAVELLHDRTISHDQTSNSSFTHELIKTAFSQSAFESSVSLELLFAKELGELALDSLPKDDHLQQDQMHSREQTTYNRRRGNRKMYLRGDGTQITASSRSTEQPITTAYQHDQGSAEAISQPNGQLPLNQHHADDQHTLNVKSLLERVEELKSENEILRGAPIAPGAKPSTYNRHFVTFYVLEERMYLDEPTWLANQDSDGDILRCAQPIDETDLFFKKHPEIAFAVFKHYDSMQERPHEDDIGQAPEFYGEGIDFITKEMQQAITEAVNLIPRKDLLYPDFDASKPFFEPLLLLHSCHLIKDKILAKLRPKHGELIKELFDAVLEDFEDLFNLAQAHKERGLVSRKTLPFIFQPGEVVVSKEGNHIQGYMVRSWPSDVSKGKDHKGASGIRDTYRGDDNSSLFDDIDSQEEPTEDREEYSSYRRGEYIDPDTHDSEENDVAVRNIDQKPARNRQDKLKPVSHEWAVDVWFWEYTETATRMYGTEIIKFETAGIDGEVDITFLSCYPLRYVSKATTATLEQRGKAFGKFDKHMFVSYQEDDNLGFSNIDERYMIDTATYNRLHPRGRSQRKQKSPQLSDDDAKDGTEKSWIFLYPPTIIGYNMRLKKWIDLYVDRISEVAWNNAAFEHLVIDPESKDLIQALVGSKLAAEKGTDLIVGKGNGLLVLLHGPPGTGKTFTAEGVAEFAKKPLYRVTCGDIGTTPEHVEKYLQSVLHLGRIWDCVVLLDEADVFLEERGENDMQRNALVSVFLRCLEYYDGILILTSNRVGTFDEAFKSRIQLSLYYARLTQPQRRKIWRNFVHRVRDIDSANVDADEILDHLDELSEYAMNGREIRNSITTARQLAVYKGQTFGYQHLKHVIGVANKFEKYLKDLRDGLSDDDIKRGQGYR